MDSVAGSGPQSLLHWLYLLDAVEDRAGLRGRGRRRIAGGWAPHLVLAPETPVSQASRASAHPAGRSPGAPQPSERPRKAVCVRGPLTPFAGPGSKLLSAPRWERVASGVIAHGPLLTKLGTAIPRPRKGVSWGWCRRPGSAHLTGLPRTPAWWRLGGPCHAASVHGRNDGGRIDLWRSKPRLGPGEAALVPGHLEGSRGPPAHTAVGAGGLRWEGLFDITELSRNVAALSGWAAEASG
jgi:hypothetical protein